MNLLVTGGSGFIGRNIAECLSGEYTVLAPPRSELNLLDEAAVGRFFRANHVDVVIHGAVKPGHRNAVDLNRILYENTRMFFNLIRHSAHYGKLIFLSSGSVYDARHYKPKMDESFFDRYMPEDENGFSKYICAKQIERLDHAVELRLFGVFGKYEDYSIRFISNAICKALFDLPITIKQNRSFDYLYIRDLMPILRHFIHRESPHAAYNITPDHAVDLYAIAKKIEAISGKDLPIIVGQPGLAAEYSGDNTRLRQEMPDIAFTPLDQAIKELFRWYSANKDSVNKELLLFDK